MLVARSRDIDRQVIAELTTETARRRARSRRLRALRCQSAVDGTADRTAPDLPVVRADGGDFDVVLLRHGRAGVSELRGRSLDVDAALDSRSDRLSERLRVIQVHSAPSLGETNCPPGRNSGERYGVACMTVQQALRILKDDGLVISRQGSGMYTHASGSNAP